MSNQGNHGTISPDPDLHPDTPELQQALDMLGLHWTSTS